MIGVVNLPDDRTETPPNDDAVVLVFLMKKKKRKRKREGKLERGVLTTEQVTRNQQADGAEFKGGNRLAERAWRGARRVRCQTARETLQQIGTGTFYWLPEIRLGPRSKGCRAAGARDFWGADVLVGNYGSSKGASRNADTCGRRLGKSERCGTMR